MRRVDHSAKMGFHADTKTYKTKFRPKSHRDRMLYADTDSIDGVCHRLWVFLYGSGEHHYGYIERSGVFSTGVPDAFAGYSGGSGTTDIDHDSVWTCGRRAVEFGFIVNDYYSAGMHQAEWLDGICSEMHELWAVRNNLYGGCRS